MSRFDGADIQLREPVDEAAYLGATIDGAVLRTEHVDIQVRDTGTPVPLGSFRTHPAAVKCLGMNDVAIEILDEQAVVTRRQQRGADVPGKQNLRFRIIEIEVSGGMQVVRGIARRRSRPTGMSVPGSGMGMNVSPVPPKCGTNPAHSQLIWHLMSGLNSIHIDSDEMMSGP